MKRFILAAAVVALALPVLAQDDFNVGEVTLGLMQRDSDTNSAKFLEYRDLPQGPVLPWLRLFGKKGEFRYDIVAKDITQKDQRFGAKLSNDTWRFTGSYSSIPHNFGNGGRSLLQPIRENEWRISDSTQEYYQAWLIANQAARNVSYTTLSALVAPGLEAAPSNIDIKLVRGRTNLALELAPKEAKYTLGVTYFHERRSGTRAANGTSFGFGNVVETPEPLRYISQDFGVRGSILGDWGSARASFNYNDFKNAFTSFAFDNPFRVTDSSHPSAYSAPSNTTVDGAKSGLFSLWPENNAVIGGAGVSLKLGSRSRLTADVALGSWKQNETPFIPYTTNTAVELPDGHSAATAPLPANKLDGKISTTSLSAYFTSRLSDALRLNARYRRYDLDNKTGRIRFEEGYTRFDAVWEEIPRISVPYGFTNDSFEALLNYSFGKATLEGGYKYTRMQRTFRESRETTENGFRAALDVRGNDWMTLRGLFEFGSRDYDEYDTGASEHASYLHVEDPVNQLALRRPDQAKRDLTRIGGMLQISPSDGKANLFLSYTQTKQDFDDAPVPKVLETGSEAPLGLQSSDYETFTLEGDFSPSERVTFYAFYTRENIDDFQKGRQSGATVSFNPADDWTSTVADKVDTAGAGASFVMRPDKWFLDLFARYQKADGNNAFTAGANRGTPVDIPLYDDTKLTQVWAKLKYQIAAAWSCGTGIGYEKYEIQDSQTDGILNYMPGSFFLATNLGNYEAWVGYVNVSHTW